MKQLVQEKKLRYYELRAGIDHFMGENHPVSNPSKHIISMLADKVESLGDIACGIAQAGDNGYQLDGKQFAKALQDQGADLNEIVKTMYDLASDPSEMWIPSGNYFDHEVVDAVFPEICNDLEKIAESFTRFLQKVDEFTEMHRNEYRKAITSHTETWKQDGRIMEVLGYSLDQTIEALNKDEYDPLGIMKVLSGRSDIDLKTLAESAASCYPTNIIKYILINEFNAEEADVNEIFPETVGPPQPPIYDLLCSATGKKDNITVAELADTAINKLEWSNAFTAYFLIEDLAADKNETARALHTAGLNRNQVHTALFYALEHPDKAIEAMGDIPIKPITDYLPTPE